MRLGCIYMGEFKKEKNRGLDSESGAKNYDRATKKLGGPSGMFSDKEYNEDEIFEMKMTKFSSDIRKIH